MSSTELSSPHSSLPDWTAIWQDTLNWQPTTEQIHKFQALYNQILDGNQRLNLTRIIDPVEFCEKHLWDSLRGIQDFLPAHSSTPIVDATSPPLSPVPSPPVTPFAVIDIGTGGGFPGVPIAIARPNWSVTLLDSTRKKIAFLDQLVQVLGLNQVKTLVGRVEEVGQQRYYRECYNLATIRAVAAAPACAEYALPLLKVGGLAVLYRGQWTDEEAEALDIATDLVGGKVEAIDAFKTPISGSDRHCIYLRKVRATPSQYPRLTGVPTQKPLGMTSTLP